MVEIRNDDLFSEETKAINRKNQKTSTLDFDEVDSCKPISFSYQYLQKETTGYAASGGGIRSATFNCGVLDYFCEQNYTHNFNYMSCVSGGGFTIGSFMTELLNLIKHEEELTNENYKLAINNVKANFLNKSLYLCSKEKNCQSVLQKFLQIFAVIKVLLSPVFLSFPVGTTLVILQDLVVLNNFKNGNEITKNLIDYLFFKSRIIYVFVFFSSLQSVFNFIKKYKKQPLILLQHYLSIIFGFSLMVSFLICNHTLFYLVYTKINIKKNLSFYISIIILAFIVGNIESIKIHKLPKTHYCLSQKKFGLNIFIFVFGVFLYCFLLCCPIIIKAKAYEYNPIIQKCFATVSISIYTIDFSRRFVKILCKKYDFTFLGQFQNKSISNAFFNKEVSQKFKDYSQQQIPILISNTTLNDFMLLPKFKEADDKSFEHKENKYDNIPTDIFTLTPFYIGSENTDYYKINKTEASIDKYVSISAAAISYSNGDMIREYNLGRFLLQLQSFNLGAFIKIKDSENKEQIILASINNIIHSALLIFVLVSLQVNINKEQIAFLEILLIMQILFIFIALMMKGGFYSLPIIKHLKQSFWITTYIDPKNKQIPDQLFLSDGGHIENLGLVSLLKRQCSKIIVADAGYDPDLEMTDLVKAIELASKKYEYIEQYDIKNDVNFKKLQNKSDNIMQLLFSVKNDKIKYKADILYLKLKQEPKAVFNPYLSTANQCFSKTETEEFIKLGKKCAKQAYDANRMFFGYDMEERENFAMTSYFY